MPYILNIDTALDNAGICIADGQRIIDIRTNDKQMDHASWIHVAIKEMLHKNSIGLKELSAVAVTSGPGSYTGLRVGMATAKGICYALDIPLITETSLYLLAYMTKNRGIKNSPEKILICPMIDARRMEVFTVIYDNDLEEIREPFAVVLDETSFSVELEKSKMIFVGNATNKWKSICIHPNALFSEDLYQVSDLASVAALKFEQQNFTGLAYSEPVYVKAFYNAAAK